MATIQSLDENIATHQNIMDNDLKNGRHGDNTAIRKNIETIKEIKNNLVSELRILPPCLEPDCPDHTTILKANDPVLDFSNLKDKKKPKKRKSKKQDSEGFAFPSKSARPTTPTQVLEPILTQNNFENLSQDPEPMIVNTQEKEPPIPRPPHPITLKTVKNYKRAKLESQRDSNELQRTNPETKQTSIENFILSVRTLTLPIPKKQKGWNLFFSSLERSFKTKNVPDEFKGEILLNLLGEKAENILVYVKDEEISDYNKLKSSVLREFEPTPLICLQSFQKAKRMPNETHVQLASRLLTNWDQYCNLRNVNDFNSLKELIVSDKLYETLDSETAVHINIKQEQNWFKPIRMGKECDMFYACKGKSFSEFTHRACHNQNDSRKDFKYIPPNARREVINLNSKENKFINSKQNSSNDEFGKITLSSALGENVEAKLIKTAIALDNNSLNHPMDCLVAITDKLNADALIPPALYESLCSINDKNNKKENEIFAESADSSITFSNDENEAECGKDIFMLRVTQII
ncbi:transposon Ty3-I Gag-Pol polyprotein [Trichonephila clavipes]|nr:transposon Ty3-I Gag-Pol polyprotein [Trichonephila clavipes]